MKHLIATTLLSLVCCAANAEAEKVISVLCNGIVSDSFFGSPKPVTTTYLFDFGKNPKNKDVMAWSMQKDGERKKYQEKIADKPLFTNFSILVSDHSVLFESTFNNNHISFEEYGKINRISGDWQIQMTEYKKKPDGMRETNRTINTKGKCESANPKF